MAFLDREVLLPEGIRTGRGRVASTSRHPSWRSLVLDQRIPSLASQGFTGLMFDTLDTPPYLELLDPARYHDWHAGRRHQARGFHWRTLARNDAHHRSRLRVVA